MHKLCVFCNFSGKILRLGVCEMGEKNSLAYLFTT